MASLCITNVALARDVIKIVGSSTVFSFSTIVAENFGKLSGYKTPIIESTGTGGGFKLFCSGVGVEYPDVSNASRQVKSSEVKLCKKNGVTNMIEIMFGYDGIVLANSKHSKQMNISVLDLFKALSKYSFDGNKVSENKFETWQQVNPDLPNIKITVFGPPPTSGTRDAFLELVMEKGAKHIPFLANLNKTDKKKFKGYVHAIREDGKYIEAGENDNLIIQKLSAFPEAFGIFGFSFLDQNMDKIQGSKINNVEVSFENIASKEYPVSRSLYFYVKREHLNNIPGLREYITLFTKETTLNENGILADKGLITLTEEERKKLHQRIQDELK